MKILKKTQTVLQKIKKNYVLPHYRQTIKNIPPGHTQTQKNMNIFKKTQEVLQTMEKKDSVTTL